METTRVPIPVDGRQQYDLKKFSITYGNSSPSRSRFREGDLGCRWVEENEAQIPECHLQRREHFNAISGAGSKKRVGFRV